MTSTFSPVTFSLSTAKLIARVQCLPRRVGAPCPWGCGAARPKRTPLPTAVVTSIRTTRTWRHVTLTAENVVRGSDAFGQSVNSPVQSMDIAFVGSVAVRASNHRRPAICRLALHWWSQFLAQGHVEKSAASSCFSSKFYRPRTCLNKLVSRRYSDGIPVLRTPECLVESVSVVLMR